ncbi:MAG: hypothetical protein WKG07_09175 [Hymenobacter sp.]
MRREDIRHFALHPGGRKILEAIEKALSLSRDDNRYAYRVLRELRQYVVGHGAVRAARAAEHGRGARRQRRAGAQAAPSGRASRWRPCCLKICA